MKKRKRKGISEEEKRARGEKKQKEKKEEETLRAKRAKAAFVASIAAPAPVPPAAKAAPVQLPPTETRDLELPPNANLSEDPYVQINAPECNGTANFGDIEAVLDDAYEDPKINGEPDSMVMKNYMKAIMKRFQHEDSRDFFKDKKNGPAWLKEYLKNHEYWIRSDCCRWMCHRLGVKFHIRAYYRDVFVWFPDEIGGIAACMPSCPSCKRNTNMQKHSYPMDHPGRRVVTFDSYYYIMSRQYLCTECRDEHKSRRDAANGGSFEKVQYTVMASQDEVLKRLPEDLFYQFPAVLSHKAGLDLTLARSLRPLFDKGLRPYGIASWLLELHALRYFDAHIQYEIRLARHRSLSPAIVRPMFSKFGDRKFYNGAVPSGLYLSQAYKREHKDIRPQLDREMKKISVEQLSIDASAKAPKKLSQYNGKRMYESLQTGTNEIGQIRVQVLAGSDSHEQLNPALMAMANTLEEHGQEGPRIAFSDNPARDEFRVLWRT